MTYHPKFLLSPNNRLSGALGKDAIHLKSQKGHPVRVAQLVRASLQYAKVVGSIPGQGTYKKQAMNAKISGTTNRCFSLKKSIQNKKSKWLID